MITERLRNYGFWILDFLRGSPIRKHYCDIKSICDKEEGYEDRIRLHLDRLLSHAVNKSEFYKEYKGYKSINDFPVIDKNVIKENYNQILAKDYNEQDLHNMSTSGSTGTPFTILQDKDKRNRVLAEIIYFGEEANYKLGDRNVFFKAWSEHNKKSKLQAYMQNLIMLDISKMNDERLEEIRQTLKKNKVKCILGIAYSLDIISKYLLEKGDTPDMFNIKIVISGAEVLHLETRENLKKVFGCDVVSRYSNQENGILAQEFLNKTTFKINTASYYYEFLKLDSDEYASPGELSRIVLTDLFNYAMPMVRYDTGDLAIVGHDSTHGKVIKTVEGKQLDFIYNTEGEMVSPVAVAISLREIPNYFYLKQFQLIQEDKKTYVMKLNGAKGLIEDSEMIYVLKKLLGSDAKILVMHVDGIPTLESGKFKKVICNYKPINSN